MESFTDFLIANFQLTEPSMIAENQNNTRTKCTFITGVWSGFQFSSLKLRANSVVLVKIILCYLIAVDSQRQQYFHQ